MKAFMQLYREHVFGPSIVKINHNEPIQVLSYLPEASHIRRWLPGLPITNSPNRFLIAVSIANGVDMALLDAVNSKLEEAEYSSQYHVDTFEINEWHGQEELEQFFPDIDIRIVFHTPVVGYWKNGTFQESKSGAVARNWILETFHLELNAIRAVGDPAFRRHQLRDL